MLLNGRSLRLCALIILGVVFLGFADFAHAARAQTAKGIRSKATRGSVQSEPIQVKRQFDSRGRLRARLLIAKTWSEILIDHNADGVAEIWELESAKRTLTLSQLYHGQYLKLEVKDWTKEGQLVSIFALNIDQKKYDLVEQEMVPRGTVFFASGSADQTVQGGIQRAYVDTWYWHGDDIGLACQFGKPITQIQSAIQWIQELKDKTSEDARKEMAKKFSEAKGISSGCKTSAAWPALTEALVEIAASGLAAKARRDAALLLTSDRRVGPPTPDESSAPLEYQADPNGRFLQCLYDRGLGLNAARIELNLQRLIDREPSEGTLQLSCPFREVDLSGTKPFADFGTGAAERSPAIRLFLPLAEHQAAVGQSGSDTKKSHRPMVPLATPASYSNVLFHELLHSAGIGSEPFVDAAVGCCGSPESRQRSVNCSALDRMIAEQQNIENVRARLTRAAPDGSAIDNETDSKLVNFWDGIDQSLARDFDIQRADAEKITRLAYTEIAEFERIYGTEYFENCEKTGSYENCAWEYTNRLQQHFEQNFEKKCNATVKGLPKRSPCIRFNQTFVEVIGASAEKLIGRNLNCRYVAAQDEIKMCQPVEKGVAGENRVPRSEWLSERGSAFAIWLARSKLIARGAFRISSAMAQSVPPSMSTPANGETCNCGTTIGISRPSDELPISPTSRVQPVAVASPSAAPVSQPASGSSTGAQDPKSMSVITRVPAPSVTQQPMSQTAPSPNEASRPAGISPPAMVLPAAIADANERRSRNSLEAGYEIVAQSSRQLLGFVNRQLPIGRAYAVEADQDRPRVVDQLSRTPVARRRVEKNKGKEEPEPYRGVVVSGLRKPASIENPFLSPQDTDQQFPRAIEQIPKVISSDRTAQSEKSGAQRLEKGIVGSAQQQKQKQENVSNFNSSGVQPVFLPKAASANRPAAQRAEPSSVSQAVEVSSIESKAALMAFLERTIYRLIEPQLQTEKLSKLLVRFKIQVLTKSGSYVGSSQPEVVYSYQDDHRTLRKKTLQHEKQRRSPAERAP